MSGAYSGDLRGRVLDAVDAGLSARQAAARFEIGVATAIRWVRRWRESGERTARKQGHPIRSKLDVHEAYLFGLIEQTVDITVRRQGYWVQRRPDLREYPAHLVDFIMRRSCGVASAGFQVFCV